MRAPVCLEDRTLLEEEPFVSHFPTRKPLDHNVVQRVVNLVERAPGGYSAVEAWVNMAFEPEFSSVPAHTGYSLRNLKQRGPSRPSRKQIECFVRFYWRVCLNAEPMEFLRTQKLQGLKPYLVPDMKQEPMESPPLSPLTELGDGDHLPIDATLSVATVVAAPTVVSASPPIDRIKREPSNPPRCAKFEAPPSTPDRRTLETRPAGWECVPDIQTPIRDRLRPRPAATKALEPSRRRFPPRSSKKKQAPAILKSPQPDTSPVLALGSVVSVADAEITFSAPKIPTQITRTLPHHETVAELRVNRPVPSLPPFTPNVILPTKSEVLDDDLELLCLPQPTMRLENYLDQPVAAHDPFIIEQHCDKEPVIEDIAGILPKPPLHDFPPIWAQSRQEVCESFSWFRSYQSGVYQRDDTVKGYFLSAHRANRDCFEHGGKIIISHGGGKAESSHMQRGGNIAITKAAQDQRAQDPSVRALMNTYRTGQPVVLLIDDKYEAFPFDLSSKNVYMTVLGFYRIIHAWAEHQPSRSNHKGFVVRYKFAFQWCEDQGQPWWWSQGQNDSNASGLAISDVDVDMGTQTMVPTQTTTSPLKPPFLYSQCQECFELSPRVYLLAWACLNPNCSSFWRDPTSGYPLSDQLEYNPAFFSLIDFSPLPSNYTLLPEAPNLAPKDGIVTAYAHSRGWHCRKCGRLSCRSAWEHYQCPNCKDTHKIIQSIRPANTFTGIRLAIGDKFMDSQLGPRSYIERLPTRFYKHSGSEFMGHYQTFVLPEGRGMIHLIKSHRIASAGADKIFEAYQEQASEGTLHFRRWPLRSHKLRGPLLTNYFSQNSGETYHYVGGADNTVPFDRAPAAVLQAHGLIEERIFDALGMQHKFNEVLSAAYMEKQSMAFHSDSERGLGPVVAGLSLGSPALMHFRVLSKYAPRDQPHSIALTVALRHGDVLMMEGAGVQDFYEHTVIPTNFRIAATARWIEPHHA